MQGHYFIYQLLVGSHFPSVHLTYKTSICNKQRVCQICHVSERRRKHFSYIFFKYGDWKCNVNCNKCVDPDWCQIGTAARIVHPAITWNCPSEEWCELLDWIMSLYNACGWKKYCCITSILTTRLHFKSSSWQTSALCILIVLCPSSYASIRSRRHYYNDSLKFMSFPIHLLSHYLSRL